MVTATGIQMKAALFRIFAHFKIRISTAFCIFDSQIFIPQFNMKYLLPILFLSMFFNAFSQIGIQPNIIFIVQDDLNDYVEGFNGHPQTITPNIYNLGENGTRFLNANTAYTLCAPSRTSFLLGKSCDYHQIFTNDIECDSFRSDFPSDLFILTLPEYLKDAGGYFTYSINKVFHCNESEPDFDQYTIDPCSKSLSWNKAVITEQDDAIQDQGSDVGRRYRPF